MILVDFKMHSAANRNAFEKYCETIDWPTRFENENVEKIGKTEEVTKTVNDE